MIFHTSIGENVAKKNDKNNKDCVIKVGNAFKGNKTPTNIDCEKSGDGNNNNPINKPKIIDIYAFFSSIKLL